MTEIMLNGVIHAVRLTICFAFLIYLTPIWMPYSPLRRKYFFYSSLIVRWDPEQENLRSFFAL